MLLLYSDLSDGMGERFAKEIRQQTLYASLCRRMGISWSRELGDGIISVEELASRLDAGFRRKAIILTGRAGNRQKEYEQIIDGTMAYLKNENGALSERKMKAIARHVYDESERYHIDYRLVLALMKVESGFRKDAVSSKGAVGLLQIKPSLGKTVAKDIGIKWRGDSQLHEPEKNIKIGVCHLSGLIKQFETLSTALHAYNGGVNRAKADAAQKNAFPVRFASAVIKEYSKNLSLLPEP